MHGVNDLYDAVQRAHEYQLLAEQVEPHACPLILTVGHVATKTVWGLLNPRAQAPPHQECVGSALRDGMSLKISPLRWEEPTWRWP